MLDLNPVAETPSPPQRKALEFLRSLKEDGRPIVLTINGEVDLIVKGRTPLRMLMELAEDAERFEALEESVADMRAGRVIPAEEVFAEMRQILADKRAR